MSRPSSRTKRAVVVALVALASFATPRPATAQWRNDAPAPQNGETITLAIGESKTISARDVRNYSEGVAGIIDIKLTTDASQFVLNGRHQGSTTLLLIKSDGSQVTLTIDVFARAPQVVERELAQLLEGLPGVRVRRVGAHIVIDGTVSSDADLKRVQHVTSLYPGEVDSFVSVAGSGVSSGVAQAQRFVIRIDFYFVQYDTESTFAAGIGWPSSIGGGSLQDAFTYDFLGGVPRTATATLANQPLPRLDIASTRGWAKVLRQATVITNNDVEAIFSNGGEQNFSVTTGIGVGVQKIPFGTELVVLPKYNPEQREIEVKVSADISDLTASASGTSLPGRQTSKLTTNVSLKLGQSLVLSGIRRETTTHNISGLPVLKDIPVLGLLFGSHSQTTLITEGAIFVVPSVIATIPASAQELVNSALAKFKDYHGGIENVNAYDKQPGGGVGIPASR